MVLRYCQNGYLLWIPLPPKIISDHISLSDILSFHMISCKISLSNGKGTKIRPAKCENYRIGVFPFMCHDSLELRMIPSVLSALMNTEVKNSHLAA